MSTSTEITCEELIRQKADLLAKMAKVERMEQETAKKEAEEKAACLAEEKAVRKVAKKGKKRAVGESGADAGAEGSKAKKRAKTKEVALDDEEPLEIAEVSCKR